MQAPIPQELSALIALQQGMQQGRVSPVTPQGSPTVAAQLTAQAQQPAQQPAQPAMQGIIQQAGNAAQIEAMKQQQMQRAIQQLVAQQRPGIEGGIAAAPGAQTVRMADGGIVGYAEPGVASDPGNEDSFYSRLPEESGIKKIAQYFSKPQTERRPLIDELFASLQSEAPATVSQENVSKPTAQALEAAVKKQDQQQQQNVPSQGKRPPVSASDVAQRVGGTDIVNQLIGQERALYGNINTAAPTGEEIASRDARDYQARRQFLISQGVDPDAVNKRIEEDKALFKKQQDLIQSRIASEQAKDSPLSRMSEALMGFRQMRGQGIGTGIASSASALTQGINARQKAIREQEDLQIRVADLEMTRRRALEDARQATAEGRWKDAQAQLGLERAASNEKAKLIGGTFGQQAGLALRQREIEEVKLNRAATSRQHAEQMDFNRKAGLLNAAIKDQSTIAQHISEQYAKHPDVVTYSLNRDNPEAKAKYDRVITERDKEIAQATSNQNQVIDYLQAALYGPKPQFRVNKQTGKRIMSIDGGKTWQEAGK